jgi:cytochrome c-type biogenesis protein
MTESWTGYVDGPFGFAIAFAAGLLSFLSPCVLPLVPVYIAHLTGTTVAGAERASRALTVSHAVAFVAGFAVIFSLLGASVGLIGATLGDGNKHFFTDHARTLEKIAGVALIIMGLNLIGIIKLPWLARTYSVESMSSTGAVAVGGGAGGGSATMTLGGGGGWGVPGLQYGKSFVVGAAFAVGWTPCIGPVLTSINALALESGDAAQGFFLLLVYSLGLGVPFILTGLAVIPMTSFLRRIRPAMPVVEVVAGVLVIFVGALIFLNDATIFNDDFSEIPFLDRFNEI